MKTALVTGTTSGIGRVLLKTLLGNALGSGCRNETKLPSSASDPALGEKVYALCERELP